MDKRNAENVMNDRSDGINEDIVYGRRPVAECIEGERVFNKILVSKSALDSIAIRKIVASARQRKIVVSEVEKVTIDRMAPGVNHQGILGFVAPIGYVEIEDIVAICDAKKEDLFIVLADGIMDPQNLGSIIRTANACGAHGLVVPARRGAQVSSAVVRASAGAAVHTPIARVNNLVQAIEKLKSMGAWVVGTSPDGKDIYYDADLTGKLAVVVGNEGEGMSRLVRENCDFLVSIPMAGKMSSLNAGVAWSVVAYEVMRQRAKSVNRSK